MRNVLLSSHKRFSHWDEIFIFYGMKILSLSLSACHTNHLTFKRFKHTFLFHFQVIQSVRKFFYFLICTQNNIANHVTTLLPSRHPQPVHLLLRLFYFYSYLFKQAKNNIYRDEERASCKKGVKNDFPIFTFVTFAWCFIIYCSFNVMPLSCMICISRLTKIYFHYQQGVRLKITLSYRVQNNELIDILC